MTNNVQCTIFPFFNFRNSRTSLTEVSPPNPTLEGIRRHNEWNEPIQPVIGSTSHPLSPPPTSPPPDSPEDTSDKKAKMIGSYAKPYKSFGKIDPKTDLIDEYMQDIPEEGQGEYDPMRMHATQEHFPYDSPSDADEMSGPNTNSQVFKPQAVKFSQPPEETNTFQTMVNSPRRPSSEDRSSPVNASNQSAFSTVGQEPGLASATSPNPRGEKIRSPKTVSIREENVNERGERVETITTTVTTGKAAQAITITAQDITVNEDDDDDDYFDDDSFDEDQELEDYSEEPGTKRSSKKNT